METYMIQLAYKTIEQARALLESEGFNIIEYNTDLDYIKAKGDKDPYLCFSDISATIHSNHYLW